jgi:ribonuclease HII
MILGIDEVGRGPWAGPLVVGAVVLGGAQIDGLTDSKRLSKKRRDQLDVIIREQASAYGLGWVHAEEIDELGLSESLRLATRRAVEQIQTPYHEIIIDGTINFLDGTSKGQYVKTMPKADLLIPSVSAASIIAKVARDNWMTEQDDVYPGYKFGSHAGYGVAFHREAIEELGVTPLHRLSFAPLVKYARPVQSAATVSGQNGFAPGLSRVPTSAQARAADVLTQKDSQPISLTVNSTKKIGDMAEDEVANYLVRNGHEIIHRNWKTKYCEIDIVSRKQNTLYFTEVKYRKRADQGGGLAAITPTKLHKMKFAVKLYVQSRHAENLDQSLAVCSVTGEPPQVDEFIILD